MKPLEKLLAEMEERKQDLEKKQLPLKEQYYTGRYDMCRLTISRIKELIKEEETK